MDRLEKQSEQLTRALDQLRNQRQQMGRLKDRIERLERVLDACLGDAAATWLFRHRAERMDPSVPIFDPLRAAFHLMRYEFAVPLADGQRVVDAACGTGYGSRLLAEQGRAAHVAGFDICPDTIAYARAHHSHPRVSFQVADIAQLPIDAASVDLVVSFETIEHVADDRAVIAEFARVLSSGGRLVISTPNAWPLACAPHHVREYDRSSFAALLQERFRIDTLSNQNSGSDSPFNHGQPAGLTPTQSDNAGDAECFLAVCTKR